jgi:hypothetical protein
MIEHDSFLDKSWLNPDLGQYVEQEGQLVLKAKFITLVQRFTGKYYILLIGIETVATSVR